MIFVINNFKKKKIANCDPIILKGKYIHMMCITHINESVMRVRNAIKYAKQFLSKLSKFKKYAKIGKELKV